MDTFSLTSDELAFALIAPALARFHQAVGLFMSHHRRSNLWLGVCNGDRVTAITALRLRRDGGIRLAVYRIGRDTDAWARGVVHKFADAASESEFAARSLTNGLADLARKPSVRMPSLSVTLRHAFDWGESAGIPHSGDSFIKIDRPSLEVRFHQVPGWKGLELPRGRLS